MKGFSFVSSKILVTTGRQIQIRTGPVILYSRTRGIRLLNKKLSGHLRAIFGLVLFTVPGGKSNEASMAFASSNCFTSSDPHHDASV